MDRTKALTDLEYWYTNLTDAETREVCKTEIRRIYIPSYAEDLIRHLEKVAKEKGVQCESK